MNSVFIVGRIKEIPVLREVAPGVKVATLLMEAEKNFRNADGQVEIEQYQVTLWRGIAESLIEISQVGDPIAVRGRLQANNFRTKDERMVYNAEVIAEKVSFIK